MHKRTAIGVACIAALVAVIGSVATTSARSSAGKASALTGTLRIFAYSDAFEPTIFDPFVKANPKLSIKKAEIASDSEAVAKLKAGFQTDIVNSCAGPVDDERRNGSLQPIDTSRITDWERIYPFFKKIKGVSVNGKIYMLPLVGGAYGLVYRPSAFKTPPKTWKDLFTTTKRITEPDDPLTNIIVAALALGYYPPQAMTNAQLAKVKALLIQQKKHVTTYYTGSALPTLWENGEVDIVPTDITLVNQVKGKDAAFAPMNPPLAWTCGYSIASHAKNLKAVYAFLNYALSPFVQDVQAKKFSYLVSSKRSVAKLSTAVLKRSGQTNIPRFTKAATFGLPPNNAAWTAAWQAVKAG